MPFGTQPMTLFNDDHNPCPKDAVSGFIITQDGVKLRYARWRPRKNDAGKARGTVCIFQGRSEYIEKYFEIIEELLQLGFGVATLDWRGQGLSQRLLKNPKKGYVRRFKHYDEDIKCFVNEVVLPDCPGPHYALGHSMGAHILIRNARRNALPFERMVLTAPMVELAPTSIGWGTAEFIASLVCAFGGGGLKLPGGKNHDTSTMTFAGNPLTHDEGRFDRNQAVLHAHPELAIGSPTFRWLKQAFISMNKINHPEFTRAVSTPMLIIASGEDKVVSTPALYDYGAKLVAGHTVNIPRASHEVMMESEMMRQQFWSAFNAFIPGEPYLTQAELELIGRSTELTPEQGT